MGGGLVGCWVYCGLAGVEPEKQGKFNDQGWQGLYYLVAWCCGAKLMFATEWGAQALRFDSTGLFQDYPAGHVELTPGFKAYYLLQASFWVHQLLVLYIEEWRKVGRRGPTGGGQSPGHPSPIGSPAAALDTSQTRHRCWSVALRRCRLLLCTHHSGCRALPVPPLHYNWSRRVLLLLELHKNRCCCTHLCAEQKGN